MKKILTELKLIFWTALYFLIWFGALMLIKVLLLNEYKLGAYDASMALVGALVVAKTVLIMEGIPIRGKNNRAAWLIILKRTLMFMAGVFVILVLEKSIEGRHEYGGFLNALKSLPENADRFHILVNIVCIFGSILFFNLWWVLKKYLCKRGFLKILLDPVPEKTGDITN